MRLIVPIASVCVLGVGPAAVLAAPGAVLSPHRAVYDITLDRTTPGSGVSEMTGRMVYELSGSACEGYTQNLRFVTRIASSEGGTQLNDLRTSSWEEAGAARFRFNSTQFRDEQLAETSQGDASRSDKGVSVELAKPERKTVPLDGNVYFPIQHSLALLEAAGKGQPIFKADLYDGSEKGEKVYQTTAAIGRKIAPGAVKSPASLANGAELDRVASWPVAVSYFEPGSEKQDAVPVYELSYHFYENGVSTKIAIDYGEFAIRGELKELSFLPQTRCEGAGK